MSDDLVPGDIVHHEAHGRGQIMRWRGDHAVVFFYEAEREKLVPVRELKKAEAS